MRYLTALAAAALMLLWSPGHADDAASPSESALLTRVTFVPEESGPPRVVEGRILTEAVDGGLLLEDRFGELFTITPEQRRGREVTGEPFTEATADELAAKLRSELGNRFHIVRTANYLIATDAGAGYAEWCGRTFERLQSGFLLYWKRDGLDIERPTRPLVAVVFSEPDEFARYATADAGPQYASVKGYFSARTNRIVLMDLTRSESGASATNVTEAQQRLQRSLFNVATVVHEATHQIAFNCGLQTRYADHPVWMSEGLAMYFEAPDLNSRTGWRTIGRVHEQRLGRFRESLRERRRPGDFERLLAGSDRFRDPDTSVDAYAESWALTYFLIRTRRDQYAEYLRIQSAKPPLIWQDETQRLNEFRSVFGEDLDQLEREFLAYIGRLRIRN